jgi:hypothetical protein
MTIEEQAQRLEASLHQLERSKRLPWAAADDRQAVLHTMQVELAAAERMLNLPATPQTAHARKQLILWSEMTRGTLNTPDAEAHAGQ